MLKSHRNILLNTSTLNLQLAKLKPKTEQAIAQLIRTFKRDEYRIVSPKKHESVGRGKLNKLPTARRTLIRPQGNDYKPNEGRPIPNRRPTNSSQGWTALEPSQRKRRQVPMRSNKTPGAVFLFWRIYTPTPAFPPVFPYP